jgi:hypothetical protein
MKPDKISGFVSGISVAVQACVIIAKRGAFKALQCAPDSGEREPYIAHATGAARCAGELIRLLRATLTDIADGNELSLCMDRDSEGDDEPEEFGDPDLWRNVNGTPVDGNN